MVIDGTGAPARRADVAIDAGIITAVGNDLAVAVETIDAGGLLVTPGWVDIHSHYDGQATWDEQLSPAPWNGVTTVVMGNCGVGFAPVHADQHDFLIQLMEGVEDIPGSALAAGALGFSTSRTVLHRAKNGELVPGTNASSDEVLGIGRVLGEVGHGVFQVAGDYVPEDKELAWMKQLSRETGRRVLFSVVQSADDPERWRRLLRAAELDADEGGQLTPQSRLAR
tara:strand:- start:26269 stop:26943 length:675 start_codon:yes stop_codon:yes gene_type:complete